MPSQLAPADDVRRSMVRLRTDAMARGWVLADAAYCQSIVRLTTEALEPLLARLVGMMNRKRAA
jgi:hypothetical protein